MEEDSTSLMFDFNFDDDVHLIENLHSQEKNGEKRAPSGSNLQPASISKQKFIAPSTHADNEDVDPSNENAPNMAPPPPQMPLTATPQAAGEKNNEPVGQVNVSSPENNLPGINSAHCSQESSSNLQLLASVADLWPSVITSPFSTPLSLAPPRPSLTTMNNEKLGSSSNAFRSPNSMEHVELESPAGSNQTFLFNPSSSHNNSQTNLMGSTNYLGFWGNSDPSNSLGADHQFAQNVGNNTFLQSSTESGNANQQLPNWFSNQNATHSPLTQSRPQANQFVAPNLFDSHFANSSMSPGASVPLRPPQFPQLNQQHNNQAAVTQDLFNSQFANPLQLNNSLLSRAQNFDLQGLLNQPIRPIPTYPTPGSSLQLTNQLLNSPIQQQSFLGRRSRAANIYDIGESSPPSSSSSKRPKISNNLETGSTSESRANELQSLLAANPFNHSRPIKNSLYDPIFETLGLPIDPHLRMFISKQ